MSMIIVSIIVYDRFDNISEWVRCWNMCETQGAELVIIHNYENDHARAAYSKFCLEAGIRYIARENKGFDIGAFQDVCMNRLEGFPEYEYLIWCTDDALPMRKDFIKQYIDKVKQQGIGVSAMEISREVKLHIRTTGFCLHRSTAERLKFPADPVLTKWDCYRFEHRDETHTFLQQIQSMGLAARQIAKIDQAPLWDSGHRKTRSRQAEHYLMFPKPEQSTKKVAFICPVFNSYPEIIGSLINQTHQNWHLFLIHDGPSSMDIKRIVEATNDDRITYRETEKRSGNWGHSIRRDWISKMRNSDFDYIVVTNADNFHAPVFCEYMIKGFDEKTIATYCSQMVHSYLGFNIINCKMQQGYVDCAGVMIKKDVAVNVGWKDVLAHSADWLFFKDIMDVYGKDRFREVKGCLLSHN